MNQTKLTFSIGLLGAMLLAGCGDVPPYTEARAERYAPPQIQLTGPDREELRRWTVLDRPIQKRDEADLLFVTVPIRATGDEILHVQYRVTFFDSAGGVMPGYPTGWLTQVVEPGAWTPIKFNSTGKATDWQMELRFAR